MTPDWESVLRQPNYSWEQRYPGATNDQLARLTEYFGRSLPQDYAAFLRLSDGAGLWHGDLWYIRLWRSADIPSWSAAYGFVPTKMHGAIAFGDDGGEEGLVFDIRPERAEGPYPVFAVNLVSVGWKEALPIADDFRQLLLLSRELLHRADHPKRDARNPGSADQR
ncbi:MAG TPA: SMI1/KNR4 family protein [Ktedonobacterales bacterium]